MPACAVCWAVARCCGRDRDSSAPGRRCRRRTAAITAATRRGSAGARRSRKIGGVFSWFDGVHTLTPRAAARILTICNEFCAEALDWATFIRPRRRRAVAELAKIATTFPRFHGQKNHPELSRTSACTRSPSRCRASTRASRRWSPTCSRRCTTPSGIGLAATQVDVHERLVVIDVSEERDQPLVLINPEIVWASDEKVAERGRLPVGARHLRRRRAFHRGARDGARRRRRAADHRGRGPAGRVHPARARSPAGQGVRRIPVAAQAQPHQEQAAQAAARRRSATTRRKAGVDRPARPRLCRGRVLCRGAGRRLRRRAHPHSGRHHRAPKPCSSWARRPPTYPLPDGGERLQYSRAPAGFEVNNVDLDARGPRGLGAPGTGRAAASTAPSSPASGARPTCCAPTAGRSRSRRSRPSTARSGRWRYKSMNTPRLLYIYIDPAGRGAALSHRRRSRRSTGSTGERAA